MWQLSSDFVAGTTMSKSFHNLLAIKRIGSQYYESDIKILGYQIQICMNWMIIEYLKVVKQTNEVNWLLIK